MVTTIPLSCEWLFLYIAFFSPEKRNLVNILKEHHRLPRYTLLLRDSTLPVRVV